MEKITKAQVKMVRSLQQKKFRDELGFFVAEGEKCVDELRKNFELVHLFREGENATHTEIEQMSSLRTPQGVIGVFKKPITNHKSQITNGLTLALDSIQDPGNLGTIIRTCDWFGVHDIFCSLDTADCYNPKVVQATMGALVSRRHQAVFSRHQGIRLQFRPMLAQSVFGGVLRHRRRRGNRRRGRNLRQVGAKLGGPEAVS